ncbi:MAG: UPF0158 family protein [Pelotomaculum sp.]
MRQVPVIMEWLVNAFANSCEYSDHYLDLATGKHGYYAPMDFPEHQEQVQQMDCQPDCFVRMPKLSKEIDREIKQAFIDSLAEPQLKELLTRALEEDVDFRKALMEEEYEDTRRRWYKYQSDCYADFLKDWFLERGIELVEDDRPGSKNPIDVNR